MREQGQPAGAAPHKWHEGRLIPIKEEIRGQPSVDFLTVALVQDNTAAHKLLKAHLAHATDLLAALNEPVEHVVVLAGAEDSRGQVPASDWST